MLSDLQYINQSSGSLALSLPYFSLPLPDLLGVGDRRGHRVRALAEPRHGHGLRLRHHAHPPRRLQDLPHGMSVTVMRQYVRTSEAA